MLQVYFYAAGIKLLNGSKEIIFFEEVAVDTSALKISAILWVQKLVYISVEVTIDIISIYILALKIYWMPLWTYVNIPQFKITVIKGEIHTSSWITDIANDNYSYLSLLG